MKQIKIFKSVETELNALESEINSWIKKNSINVVSIQGNIAPQSSEKTGSSGALSQGAFSPSDVLVMVTYEV